MRDNSHVEQDYLLMKDLRAKYIPLPNLLPHHISNPIPTKKGGRITHCYHKLNRRDYQPYH